MRASSLLYQWLTHGSHPKIFLQPFVMITGGGGGGENWDGSADVTSEGIPQETL